MTILNLLKNNFKRISTHKEILVAAIIIIPLFIAVAVLFTAKSHMLLSIAYVSDHAQNLPRNDKYRIVVVKDRPDESTLLMGTYSAIVEHTKDGSYQVDTIKSKFDQKNIQSFFETGIVHEEEKRGIGTNILGYIFMIIIMQAVALAILYPEDRLQQTFRRIMTAPVNEKQYLFAQGTMTFLCLYIPTFLAIMITHICFGVDIGFSLGMMALLLCIQALFATAFSLFISSAIERNTSLVTSCVALITCVLAGCFKSFTTGNSVLNTILNIIPQKSYMTLIQGIEAGKSFSNYIGQLSYLVIFIIGFWLLGSIITSSKVSKGVY